MPPALSARSRLKASLAQILDALEACYGPQTACAPTDPYLFLIWWHCGYPPGEVRCTRGFQSLQREIGVSPSELLAASRPRLARALQAGGMVPELRAARLQEIAHTVREEFAEDLPGALRRLPVEQARATVKKFPGIGAPGADRILLFAGIAPLAAVPSNCPHVLLRVESGREPNQYATTYAQAQASIAAQLPETLAARSRAYLLLQRHGRELCKRSRPRCEECPLARRCRFNRSGDRPRSAPRSRR